MWSGLTRRQIVQKSRVQDLISIVIGPATALQLTLFLLMNVNMQINLQAVEVKSARCSSGAPYRFRLGIGPL